MVEERNHSGTDGANEQEAPRQGGEKTMKISATGSGGEIGTPEENHPTFLQGSREARRSPVTRKRASQEPLD